MLDIYLVITENILIMLKTDSKIKNVAKLLAWASLPAIERIKTSQLDEVVISNTIPLNDQAKECKKIRQLSVAFLFAETIRRISDGDSVTSLFSEQNNNF